MPTLTATAVSQPTPVPTPDVPHEPSSTRDDGEARQVEQSAPPGDLSLPFRIEDVGGGNGFTSPFGIIRHSRDTGHGHSGIDIPLNANAPIYAVADGVIVSAEVSGDGAGGFDVKLLISGSRGEGWGFLYEHVALEPGIASGSAVTKGQLIARNGLTTNSRNNHFQLSYMFNEYTFYRDHKCWVDHLVPSSAKLILDYFSSPETVAILTARWETASEEGVNAYKELLNRERFPEGPQLCFPLGLDVRVSVTLAPTATPTAMPTAMPSATPTATHAPTSSPTPVLTPAPAPSTTPKANVIFFNAQVLTMDSHMTQAEAVAVAVMDGVILAIGNSADILEMADSQTVVIDLDGRTVVPGFVDSHSHIFNDRAKSNLNQYIPNGTLDEAQQLALELGITTLADMWVDQSFLQQFRAFEPNLKVRTKLYFVYVTNCGDVLGQWWTDQLPLTSVSGRLQVTPGVKMFADGGSCGRAAFSFELEPGYYGDLFLTEAQLADALNSMHSQGLQVAIHAIGDRAIETALNGLETVLAGQPNTLRHRIDHNFSSGRTYCPGMGK